MIDINNLKLLEAWQECDSAKRWRVSMPLTKEFPFWSGFEAKELSVVYFELDPGNMLAEHTDSAEEIVLILNGSAKATIGNSTSALSEGSMTIIPEMAPHSIQNTGSNTLKCIGIFSKPIVTSTFTDIVQPMGIKSLGPGT
ncbi:hypothetical protein GCM10008967_17330 [Bacillus carboniphilus]|uniref:Cupin type-2 domain-containing protein n=1 Tax=Bacillus carboniphilus TaxID=86663 RepID=A0ABP3FWZ7_9BACI